MTVHGRPEYPLKLNLSEEELFEIDRWYTPCDVINDYNNHKRIARHPR